MASLLKTTTALLLFAYCSLSAASCCAQIVSKGKQATALVVVESRGVSGTAFCIDPTGYYVTNEHVVRGAKGPIKLVLNCGEANEREVSARIVREDEKSDLALLLCEGQSQLASVELGRDDDLIETAEVTVFGFPLGTALAFKQQAYPNITISVGRISSMRTVFGRLESIQVDAIINPGNSGGPALDETGKVVGIVVAKIGNTGLNLLIPVSHLRKFLSAPHVAFVPPVISALQRHKPLELFAEIETFDKSDHQFSAAIDLFNAGRDPRRIELETQDGRTFRGRAVLIPFTHEPAELKIVAEFGDSAIRGWVSNSEIELDGQMLPLLEIARITRTRNGYRVETADESQETTELGQLPTEVRLSGQKVSLDLTRADRVLFSFPKESADQVKYVLTVNEGDGEVFREEGIIKVGPDELQSTAFAAILHPLGGESPLPEYLEANAYMIYDKDGLRLRDRNYVKSKSNRLLATDFTLEIEFALPEPHQQDFGNVAFIGLGTLETGAYNEPKNSAYLRIHPPHIGEGAVGLSNRPVTGLNDIGVMRSVGPHLARIRKKGKLVVFQIDVDNDGPSPDDMSGTIPDILVFVPELHDKNTHFFFGGCAVFKRISFDSHAGE